MADYYTHIGFTIQADKEERDWLRTAVQRILEDDPPEEVVQAAEDNDYDPNWDMGPRSLSSWGGSAFNVTFYSDETVDVEVVACLLQAYLRKYGHKPNRKCLAFGWADTCSKPRPGAFGGGAMVITKDVIRETSTSAWLDRTVEQLLEGKNE